MPLVTISGGIGTGIGKTAQLVASKAGLELYDDQRLHAEAVRMGVRAKDLKGIDEKAPSFFDSLRVDPQLYLDVLESVVYSVSKTGQGIIIGHGGQVLLRDFGCALHVLIHAPEDFRIEQLMGRRSLSDDGREEARKLIHKSDNEKRGFLRFAYHLDWDDLSLYDLVINTAKLGIDGSAEVILHALHLDMIQECSMQALDTIERMTLQKTVQAAMAKAGLQYYSFSRVDVPEKGKVVITGLASTEEEKARILQTAKGAPGVTSVKDEINVQPIAGY
jgi:cytidylate kinase